MFNRLSTYPAFNAYLSYSSNDSYLISVRIKEALWESLFYDIEF